MYRLHYKEYLVGLVNRHGIDPAEVMTAEELTMLLERAQKKVPRRGRDESISQYTKRLLDVSRSRLKPFGSDSFIQISLLRHVLDTRGRIFKKI